MYLKCVACLRDKELWTGRKGRLLGLENLCKRPIAYKIGVDIEKYNWEAWEEAAIIQWELSP